VLVQQSDEMQVRGHPRYADAKAGDLDAAAELLQDTLDLATRLHSTSMIAQAGVLRTKDIYK